MIICIGEAVIDMFQKNVPELGDVFYPLPGGCAYNTSITISRLGTPVAFLGRLSRNFFGEMQFKRLTENNVKVNLIIRCDQNPVLAIIKTEENKEPQYAFYDEGTSDRLLSIEELPVLPADTTCIMYGSISMVMEPIASTIESLILSDEASHKVIAFDPNIRPFMIKDRSAYLKRLEKWMKVTTIAKISSEDFEYIFPGTEPKDALQKIIDMGCRLAIVTLGPQGSIAMLKCYDGNIIEIHSPAMLVPNVIDTVGAGDTFLGAFLALLEKKGLMSPNAIADISEDDLQEALAYANKAAAIVCTRYGAEPPTLAEMDA